MTVLLWALALCVGLAALWKMGEISVRHAIGFSVIYKIETFAVGFFIFAISTGLPEISSAIVSSIENVPELSAGDLMGSSLVNMSLILGVAVCLAKEMPLDPNLIKRLYWTIALIALIFFGTMFTKNAGLLIGILLLLVYFGSFFLFHAGISGKQAAREIQEVKKEEEKKKTFFNLPPKIDILVRLFFSLFFLMLSSWLTVTSAVEIAQIYQWNLAAVGGTIIAIGTSLPELALEIHAVRKKEYALAVGDIFGSSLLNVSFILGLLLLINGQIDLTFSRKMFPFLVIVSVWMVQRLIAKKPLVRRDGIAFLVVFVAYIISSVFVFKL